MRFLAAVLLLASSAFGQTYYGSIFVSSGTRTLAKSGSPHIFSGTITVSSGASLVIEAGCEVVLPPRGKITLAGTGAFRAVGTSSDPILIRSSSGVCDGVDCTSSVSRATVKMSYVNWLNLGGSPTNINLRAAHATIDSCFFASQRTSVSGSPVVGISATTAIGSVASTEINGQTTGVFLGNSMLLLDQVDVINTVTPINIGNRNVSISILPL